MRILARFPRAITLIFAALSTAAALIVCPAASAAGCQAWTAAQPPDPGGPSQGSELNGVAVISSCDAWAVGQYGAISQTLAVDWNGSSWVLIPTPDPSASGFNVLNSVAAVSADDAWAVGEDEIGSVKHAMILRWHGHAWRLVTTPNPSPTFNSLSSVAAISASTAWAVGAYQKRATIVAFVARWNGTAWKQVPSPPSTTSSLLGVAATSAKNAWAVGYAVSGKVQQTLILHWNGTAWKRVPSPDPSPSFQVLDGVAATSTSNAWAVGNYADRNGFDVPLVLRWNGRTWTRSRLPAIFSGTANSELFSVAATSVRNVWAVGNIAPLQTLILHWNGTAWKREGSPNLSSSDFLVSVAAASASDAWSVGAYNDGTADQNLALHCC